MKIGTKTADKVEEFGRTSLRKLQEWSKEDPNTRTDDALRLIGGGLKNVGRVANLPGIRHGLQIADAPFHYLAKGAGKAAGAAGIDPRWGEWAVRAGELATGVGVGKKAAKSTRNLALQIPVPGTQTALGTIGAMRNPARIPKAQLGEVLQRGADAATDKLRTLTEDIGRHSFGNKTKASNQYYKMLNFVRQYGDELDGGFAIGSTSTHHRNQLVQIAEALVKHPEGEKILNSKAFKNIPIGDEIENYTAILDQNTKALRRVKVDEIHKLHPNVPKKTIDDALGASDFKPPNITQSDANRIRTIKAYEPEFTTDMFLDSKGVKGSFPTVDFFDKDGIKTKWKPSDGEDWGKRWKRINEHYGSNIKPEEFKKIKLDRDLATYAPDHAHLHKEILDSLPSHQQLDELIKSGEWEQLPYEQAEEILEKVSKDSLKASDRISKWRYGKIGEYFEKFKEHSKIPQKYKNKSWDELPTDIQRQFFKEHASPISRYGSRDVPNVDELMVGRKILTKNEAAFFGVKRPQKGLKINE
tara:strand:+ start:392 stop:1975 length:1584 start_codon:yes stop_codon:yes gene_type:complete